MFRFTGVKLTSAPNQDGLNSIEFDPGHSILRTPFPISLSAVSVALRGHATAGQVTLNGKLDPAIPEWIVHYAEYGGPPYSQKLWPGADPYEMPSGGYAWPRLQALLRSKLGSSIDRTSLAREISASISALLPPGTKEFSKFQNKNGFIATVDSKAHIEVFKVGSGSPINSFFQSMYDKPILYFAINRAVRRLVGARLDVPFVVHRSPCCIAKDKVTRVSFLAFVESMAAQTILIAR